MPNLYMAHGGTSFGFRSGANSGVYFPQPTSYDYTAPISEARWDTPKFHALRELLSRSLTPGETLPDMPPRNPTIEIPPIHLTEVARVLGERLLKAHPENLQARIHGAFRSLTGRLPDEKETAVLRQLFDEQMNFYAKEAGAAEKLLAMGESKWDESLPRADFAATTMLVSAIMRFVILAGSAGSNTATDGPRPRESDLRRRPARLGRPGCESLFGQTGRDGGARARGNRAALLPFPTESGRIREFGRLFPHDHARGGVGRGFPRERGVRRG
jgi:hypothetical protein